ncbi:phosphoesterase [Heterostelium album PN500]|uniref:Phosphoesterase n=1 Tax=Heterostelium pallidum (strain ATCC 26659 / Pp 5 / PN500) TaxID=670386 RepID=D3BAK4_HETP5|nr:phosphoesterase [Heterostelium album PN500]EFA81591.1 phosphoesterase [Heterostelium album PN500]|eukprot:XP_020433708.1 phosphoesterase [Heterostelium album PN500]
MIHKIGYYNHIPWFSKQHIGDWVMCIVIFLTEAVLFNFLIQPYDRYMPDGFAFQLIQYPMKPDIVPTWALMLIAFGIPILIFSAFYYSHRCLHDFHHACLGLIQTFTMTMLFTDFLKVLAGRYRPSYGARFDTENKSLIHDGRMSFPSGHSSISFATMTFLSLYLCGKLKVFRREGAPTWKIFIVLTPYMLSAFVAVSRTMDYHHDFSDILGGTVIGLCMGAFLYKTNFNALTSKECSLPKNRINPHYAKDGLLFAEKDDTLLSINVL